MRTLWHSIKLLIFSKKSKTEVISLSTANARLARELDFAKSVLEGYLVRAGAETFFNLY